MLMVLKYSDVCDRIYASTALASLRPECRVALLNPDHFEALRIVVRDSLATVFAALDGSAFSSIVFNHDDVSVHVSDDSVDAGIANEAILALAASLTIMHVKITASDKPEQILRLASSIPAMTGALNMLLCPGCRPSRIRPYP